MNAHEHTDPHGDGLTITHDDGRVWITCTSGRSEVTVGPLPADILTAALPVAPARPEGAEALQAWFTSAWGGRAGDWAAAADLFARNGLRAPEDGAA